MTQSHVYSYDAIPYESHPFAQSHPDRLAVMATLFGMAPTPINAARVLELGCASGGNLIPMAATLPGSRFTGIDLSPRQIADGQALIESVGLKNVELRYMNIMDVTPDLGEFDYIIAHGVYSWVLNETQEKIIQICRDNLSANGVAYVSYNTYPGWHFRGMIRDMMQYHTKHLSDSAVRIAQARALLDFLAQSVPTEANAYGIILKTELDLLRKSKDYYLAHEHLEDANRPIYFYEFAEQIARHDLQYLGEVEFGSMLTGNFPKSVSDKLQQVSNDIIRTEQYMDFLRNRTFRQTLLCRREVALKRNIGPSDIQKFYIGSSLKPASVSPDVASSAPEQFTSQAALALTATQPVVKAAFTYLSEVWPQSVSFSELLEAARGRIATAAESDPEVLGAGLLTAYTRNMVELHIQKQDFVTKVTAYPVASALVRGEAALRNTVTNMRHESLVLDVLNVHLVKLLDGTRDRHALCDELVKLVDKGVLTAQLEGKPITEVESYRGALMEMVDKSLANFAKAAILVG